MEFDITIILFVGEYKHLQIHDTSDPNEPNALQRILTKIHTLTSWQVEGLWQATMKEVSAQRQNDRDELRG